MGLFGPRPLELTIPSPSQIPLPDPTLMQKKKHAQAIAELQAMIGRILNDFKEQYATGAVELVRNVGPHARRAYGKEPYDVADIGDELQAEYLTAAAYGLAAGQTEDATDLTPGPDQVHPYMFNVLAMSTNSFRDPVSSYLVRAGHYLARRGGQGTDVLIHHCK